uniref:Uncharacterized protein n=1 Tax=Plectus sambesii TaxID=2011161 RepID=A0A914UJC5_9BILA
MAAEFLEWRKEKNLSYFDMFEAIGPKYEDIVLVAACDGNITTTPIDTYEYGRCYYLESNCTSNMVGSQSGMILYLDTQGYDYVPLVSNNYMYEGLMLQLTYNKRVEIGQWIKLYPTTHTTVGMKAVETSVRLQEYSYLNPFSLLESPPPCDKNPKLAFSDASQYSASTCLLEYWLIGQNMKHVRVDDIIVVEIFFTSLSIKLTERYEAMSLDNLISSSGGLIGLWAGMSFLTVFQAIAFLIEYVEMKRKKPTMNMVTDGSTDSVPTIRQLQPLSSDNTSI